MANKMPELREGLGRAPTEAETQDRSVLVCTPFCQHLGKIWRGETSKSTKRLRKRTDKSTAEITFRRVVQKSFTILSLEDRGHLTYSWALREPLLASSSSPLPASGREEKNLFDKIVRKNYYQDEFSVSSGFRGQRSADGLPGRVCCRLFHKCWHVDSAVIKDFHKKCIPL